MRVNHFDHGHKKTGALMAPVLISSIALTMADRT
jgi:hypothetical protein